MKLDNIIAERINKTIYRDGNKCIKVFDESYSKADVLNEALNHARVEETGLNIPELSEVTRINGKWAIGSQFIDKDGSSFWGAGTDDDIIKSSIKALVSAINNMCKQ